MAGHFDAPIDDTTQSLANLFAKVLENQVGERLRHLCAQQADLISRLDPLLGSALNIPGQRCPADTGEKTYQAKKEVGVEDANKRASEFHSGNPSSDDVPPSFPLGAMVGVAGCTPTCTTPSGPVAADGSVNVEEPAQPTRKIRKMCTTSTTRTSDKTTMTKFSEHRVGPMPDMDQQIIDQAIFAGGEMYKLRSDEGKGSLFSRITEGHRKSDVVAEKFSPVLARPSLSSSLQNFRHSATTNTDGITWVPSCTVPSSMEELRKEREAELMHALQSEQVVAPSWFTRFDVPFLVLRCGGVLPMKGNMKCDWYFGLVWTVATCFLVWSMVLAVLDRDSALSTHSNNTTYGVCVVLSLSALRANSIQTLLGPKTRPLEIYARMYGFLEDWLTKSSSRLLKLATLWLIAGLSRSLATVQLAGAMCVDDHDGSCAMLGPTAWMRHVAHTVTFWILTGFFTVLTYCKLHTVTMLEFMVDDFFIRFFDHQDVPEGIDEWNTLQAVLRRSAAAVEPCVLALHTCTLVTLLVAAVEFKEREGPFAKGGACAALWGCSVVAPVAMMVYASFKAASVTEKCCRVPSFVNSMIPGTNPQQNKDLRGMVQFVQQSAAGFYVRGVRLTSFMVLKIVYLLGFSIFTLIIQTTT